MEILSGIGFMDKSFWIPIIIAAVVILLVAKLAKSLLKLTILVAIIAIGVTVYANLPSFRVDNGTAYLTIKGEQHQFSTKDVKIAVEKDENGDEVTMVVFGNGAKDKVKVPFSKDFAQKFIIEKQNPAGQKTQ